MKVVADTDILSIFAKINRFDILNKLFEQVMVPQSVQSELRKGKINVGALNAQVVRLTRDELKVLKGTDERLGRGEKECFVIAGLRGMPLATNERIVHFLCREKGVGYFSLPRLLRLAILKEAITREEARQLVRLIEKEESTTIKNKEEIFR